MPQMSTLPRASICCACRIVTSGVSAGTSASAAFDQLVVYQVWRHADQVQAAALLADDLVPGGKGNQVSEALERNARAILDVGSNRLAQ